MNAWWGALSPVEHVFWIIAVAATTVLLVQLVIACFTGLDVDVDVAGHDVGGHHDIGGPHFQLLTVRGLVAFFSVFGWSGLAFNQHGHHLPLVITFAFGCGLIMMLATALIFWGLANLQSESTMDLSKAKGMFATVYLKIPAVGQGQGKISLNLQNKLIEVDAVTTDVNDIPTGASVVIKDFTNNKTTVERV